MMKKRLSIILLLFASVAAATAQSAKAVSIADSLTAVALFGDNGWGGTPTMWTLQMKLDSVASNDDLVALARSHPNAAARAVAFRILVTRRDSRYRDILYSSLHDTARFREQSFDVISRNNVANSMVEMMIDHPGFMSYRDSLRYDSLFRAEPQLKEMAPHLYEAFLNMPKQSDFDRLFTPQDRLTLDSILFFTPNLNHIAHRTDILDSLPLDERHYRRLHEMYYDEGFAPALQHLCRYRRETDKAAVIECLLEYSKGLNERHVKEGPEGRTIQGLWAVALWPDHDFLPALREVRDYEVRRTHYDYARIRFFYLALMAYDDDLSYGFIDETLRMTGSDPSTRKYHLEYFREAYEKHPNPRYQDLLDKYSRID
jgi:hypothetical protein